MGKATTALVTVAALAAPLFSPVAGPPAAVENSPIVREASADTIRFLKADPSELLFLPRAEASELSPHVVVMECRPVRSYRFRIFVYARSYGDAIVRAWLDWRVRQECRVISVVHEPSGRIYVPGEPTPAQPSGIISSMNAAKREIARYFENLGLRLLTTPGEIWNSPGYITERRFEESGTVVTTPIISTANYGNKIIVLYDMPPAESDLEARRIRNCDALERYISPRLEGKAANIIQLPSFPAARSELTAGLDRGLRGETDCPPLYR